MPNTRNSQKSGQIPKSKKSEKSNKDSCQSKMDTFVHTSTKDTNTLDKVVDETTIVHSSSSLSIAATDQAMETTLSTSPSIAATDQAMETTLSTSTAALDGIENVEVTDITALQTVLGQILKAVKPIGNMSSKINELVSDVRNFEKSLSDQKNRIDALESSVNFNDHTLREIKARTEVIEENQVTKDQMAAFELAYAKENAELRKHIIKLEEYSRRNNLIFHGIPEKENERCEDDIKSFLVEKLGIADAQSRIIINKAHRIGQRKAIVTRPIIVQFIYSAQVFEVFSKRMSLKHHATTSTSIANKTKSSLFITRDFPDDVVRTRKQLQQVLKVAKRIDPTSHLSKDKMIFNNKAHTLADCYKSEPLKVEQLGSVHQMESVLFHGRFCPLSNFFPSKFHLDGNYYDCVEQYFQHQKAKFCGAWSIAYQIMHVADPVDMKKLGDSLGKDCWPKEIQMMEMKKALTAKFSQNHNLAKFLLDTGSKTIVECNKFHSFWGNGRSLYDKGALKGTGENKLGITLEEIRAGLN